MNKLANSYYISYSIELSLLLQLLSFNLISENEFELLRNQFMKSYNIYSEFKYGSITFSVGCR